MKTHLLIAIMAAVCAPAAGQTAPADFTVCMGDTLKGRVREAVCRYFLLGDDGTPEDDAWCDISVRFDRQGRKTQTTGPGCVRMSYEYDPQGRLTLETGRPFADDPNYTGTTRYTYDRQGRLAAMETDRINDDYKRITYAYDAEGRLSEEICYGYGDNWPDDNTPVYIEVGRKRYPQDIGNNPEDGEFYGYGNAVVRVVRDQAGRPVKIFLEKGRKIGITYDEEGRVIEKKCRDAYGKPESIDLDDEGTYIYAARITSEWGPGGKLAGRVFYDADGTPTNTCRVDVKLDDKGNATQWLGVAAGAPDYMYALVERTITYY